MTAPPRSARADPLAPACPFLGLPDDPVTRFSYPSEDHRCWAAARPRTIDLPHQGAFCLGAAHPECPRHRAAPAGAPARTGPVAGGIAWRGEVGEAGATEGRGLRRRTWLLVAVVVLAIGLAAAALLGGPAIADLVRDWQPGGGAVSSASPPGATSLPPSPTPTPSPPPTPTPTPTASSAPRPTATPGRTPRPTPAPTPLRHTVAPGDTLTSIAERYGVTVAAIRRANGIDDPNLIRVGQRLVVPRR